MTFTEIWNEAFDIYVSTEVNPTDKTAEFLNFVVASGNLKISDALCMLEDIKKTASL